MLNFLYGLIAKLVKLTLLDRLLGVLALAMALYLIVSVALLDPQQKKINDFQQSSKANKTELDAIKGILSATESSPSQSLEQLSGDAVAVAELKKQIADAAAFYNQVDATTTQVKSLLKEMLAANPKLTLVSLRTLPVEPFYLPDSKTIEPNKADTNKVDANNAQPQRSLYKHGVEISIRGDYATLITYMENLQKYPKRLFWAETKLDVMTYPDTVLKLVIYSLSDQPSAPIR